MCLFDPSDPTINDNTSGQYPYNCIIRDIACNVYDNDYPYTYIAYVNGDKNGTVYILDNTWQITNGYVAYNAITLSFVRTPLAYAIPTNFSIPPVFSFNYDDNTVLIIPDNNGYDNVNLYTPIYNQLTDLQFKAQGGKIVRDLNNKNIYYASRGYIGLLDKNNLARIDCSQNPPTVTNYAIPNTGGYSYSLVAGKSYLYFDVFGSSGKLYAIDIRNSNNSSYNFSTANYYSYTLNGTPCKCQFESNNMFSYGYLVYDSYVHFIDLLVDPSTTTPIINVSKSNYSLRGSVRINNYNVGKSAVRPTPTPTQTPSYTTTPSVTITQTQTQSVTPSISFSQTPTPTPVPQPVGTIYTAMALANQNYTVCAYDFSSSTSISSYVMPYSGEYIQSLEYDKIKNKIYLLNSTSPSTGNGKGYLRIFDINDDNSLTYNKVIGPLSNTLYYPDYLGSVPYGQTHSRISPDCKNVFFIYVNGVLEYNTQTEMLSGTVFGGGSQKISHNPVDMAVDSADLTINGLSAIYIMSKYNQDICLTKVKTTVGGGTYKNTTNDYIWTTNFYNIGLYASNNIISMALEPGINGNIWIYSAPGSGNGCFFKLNKQTGDIIASYTTTTNGVGLPPSSDKILINSTGSTLYLFSATVTNNTAVVAYDITSPNGLVEKFRNSLYISGNLSPSNSTTSYLYILPNVREQIIITDDPIYKDDHIFAVSKATSTATNFSLNTINGFTGAFIPNSSFDYIDPSLIANPSFGPKFIRYKPDTYKTQYLVIGGGGGGGGGVPGAGNNIASGGGGGAGGVATGYAQLTPNTTYNITVGAGGDANRNGADSSFDNFVSVKGGGAGGYLSTAPKTGGSGGGGQSSSYLGAAGVSGQGYSGGNGANNSVVASYTISGGGGGAGGAGASTVNDGLPGVGGNGIQSSITGVAKYYAGGGGGGYSAFNGNAGGGSGGGGLGGGNSLNGFAATSGQDYTGSGGGGGAGNVSASSYLPAGKGGYGVVILSIPLDKYTGIYTGTVEVDTTSSAGYAVLTFKSNGTYNA